MAETPEVSGAAKAAYQLMGPDSDFYDDTPEGETLDLRPEHMVWSEGRWRELTAADVAPSRQSQEYRKAREEYRHECAERGDPCWLCTKPIDYRLPWPHPDSWSLDHKLTVKERPDLFMDRGNWASSHLDCNLRRGTDEPHLDLGEPSEVW
jgi:hypothetical protein